MRKKISVILCVMFALIYAVLPDFPARADSLTVTGIPSEVKVGDTFSVSIKVPANIGGYVYVEYSKDILKVTKCPGSDVGTGSTSYVALFNSQEEIVTFETKTTGTATIRVYMMDAEYSDKDPSEALPDVPKVTQTVQVINEVIPETPKSDDNSLASLKLSSGTLSPSFEYNVTNYTATVGYDVTKLVVSAKPSNEKATIESVTGDGNVSLEVGKNTIEIVVKAENGTTAKYTIVVTRKEKETQANPEPTESESQTNTETEKNDPDVNDVLVWNGEQLYVPDSIPTEKIPADFVSKLMVVNGEQMTGLSFNKGNLVVLYLNNTNGAGSLYVYNEEKKEVYPFVKISGEESYIIALVPDETKDAVPEGYEKCTLSIEGKGSVTAFRKKETAVETSSKWNLFGAETFYAAPAKVDEFYLLYCMNHAGEMGWYVYDIVEETFMRYLESTPSVSVGGNVSGDNDWQNKYAALEKELNAAKMTQYIIIAIAAAVVIILFIVILVLALKKRGQDEEILEADDIYEEEEYVDEVVVEQVQEEIPVEEVEEKKEDSEEELIVNTMTEEDEVEVEFYHMDKKDEENDLVFIDFE